MFVNQDFIDAYDDQKPRTVAQIMQLASLFQMPLDRAMIQLEIVGNIKTGSWRWLQRQGFCIDEAEKVLVLDSKPKPSTQLELF